MRLAALGRVLPCATAAAYRDECRVRENQQVDLAVDSLLRLAQSESATLRLLSLSCSGVALVSASLRLDRAKGRRGSTS